MEIDRLIETCEYAKTDSEDIWNDEFWNSIIYYLKKYKEEKINE